MHMSRRSFARGTHFVRVALLAFAVLGLTQCRLVADRITGVDAQLLHGRSARTCLRDCERERRSEIREEERRHRARIRQCRTDISCLEDENERHQNQLADIEREYQECLEDCHHQGGGSGGD
jgi:hypothetical protein